MADAVKMRMVIPFRFEKPGKALPAKFGQRLIPMWSFGETSGHSVKPMRLQCASSVSALDG
jgi:hypothetical protein